MSKTSKKENHPWVAAAAICQGLLEEKDNVLSIIRMVDVFNLPKPPGWDGKTNLQLPLIGIVALRSGDAKGTRAVRIYGVSPKGKRQKLLDMKAEFLGGNTGVNIKLNMMFGFKSEGTHWLDIYVDKWLATRIPVSIVFQSEMPPNGESGAKADKPEQ
jgi:hypothetical protein